MEVLSTRKARAPARVEGPPIPLSGTQVHCTFAHKVGLQSSCNKELQMMRLREPKP